MVIKVTCSNSRIRVLTPEVSIVFEDGTGILRKYITVEGSEPNVDGVLRATTNNKLSEAKIYVVPEKDLLLSEGMTFQPESLTLRPNQPKRVYLLVYVKMIEGGSKIRISSDKESVHVSKEEIIVNESDAIRHVAKYELEVWGEGAGQDAMIIAEYEPYMALIELHVRSKEEDEAKGRKGMFNEPEFDYDTEPLLRTKYSAETGKVIIYVNFPSVQHYIGEHCQYKKTLPAQVFLADLVAERCFYEIAKKKVDTSGALIRPEGRLDAIQSVANNLSQKNGKKVHEALVDQRLIEEAKSII